MATSAQSKIENSGLSKSEFIAECLNIAIDEKLGSPFMIKKAKEKGVKKDDITSWEDLAEHFGSTDPEIFRKYPINYTITKWAFQKIKDDSTLELSLAETGGTTGPPKKTLYLARLGELPKVIDPYDLEIPYYSVLTSYAVENLKDFNIPLKLNWLAIVPTGPHAIGKWAIKLFERDIAQLLYLIDLDPRFIKKAMMTNPQIGGIYLKHLQEQTENIIRQEFPFIQGIFTTGVLLEKMFPMIQRLRTEGNLQAILHGGTPMPEETYKILLEELQLPVMGFYGQSLFGTLFQSSEIEAYNIDYYPHPRMNSFVVSDPFDISTRLSYGDTGTVVSQRVSPECVIPALVQTGDLATLIPPKGKFKQDGLRNPHRELKQGQQIGVY